MILVSLMGGLGNQLFEYAAAYALAQKRGDRLLLDKKAYHTAQDKRTCNIERFALDFPLAVLPRSLGTGKLAVLAYRKLFGLRRRMLCGTDGAVVQEAQEFACQDLDAIPHKNLYLIGYWQNVGYFDACRADLVRQFRPKALRPEIAALAERLRREQAAAVHVRRGDYKVVWGGKCLDESYYAEALGQLCAAGGLSGPLYVFTDDVEFCRQRFARLGQTLPLGRVRYISEQCAMDDVEEFWLMAQCRDFVVANSTYSWWAAYLSEAPGKRVIAPVVDMWKESFYPASWHKLPARIEAAGTQ